MKKRSQIEEKYKWDLSSYCKSPEEFYSRLKKCESYKSEVVKFEGKLSDDKVLLKYLEFDEKVSKEFSALGVYAYMLFCQNVANKQANEMQEEYERIATDFSIADSFGSVEISEFSDEKLKGLLANKKFSKYKRLFESVLRHKKHVLSKKEEKLLSGMSFLGGFSDTFHKFLDGDIKFDKVKDSKGKLHELDFSKYPQYMEGSDREIRKNTFKNINGKIGQNINFIASNYISDLKADCYFAKVRGYNSALSASIYNEEASEEVYRMLIKKCNDNASVLQNYAQIKQKMLGIKDFANYDVDAQIIKAKQSKYTYDEAIELVKKATVPLGEEYVSLIQRAKDEKWIDVMPNEGKYSGAYSISSYGCNPMVLMNFDGDLASVFTLAHELGHALHSYYSNKHQSYQDHDYVIFVAEVASTVNEMLLLKYLLSQSKTDAEKISLWNKLFSEVKGTIFRQAMFSEFEVLAHQMYEQGQPLSKDKLCDMYYDLNKKYFGKRVKLAEEVKYEWARIPHFYTPFYVYKYATGMISALNLSKKLFDGVKGEREKYLNFLSSGSSASPIKLLQVAGCDLEKEDTFDEVFAELKDIIKQWQKLI